MSTLMVEQSIFLSLIRVSIKKVRQIGKGIATKQKQKKRLFVCQKFTKYFLVRIDEFYKIWTEGLFWTIFFF